MTINIEHPLERFQITAQLTVEENLKALFTERFSTIRDQIRKRENDHKTIHEVRKSIKRIRAALRLIRDEIGYSHYLRENMFFRDLSRKMAPMRDSFVLCQTFKSLENNYPGLISTKDYSYLEEQLSIQIKQDHDRFIETSGGFTQVLTDISRAEQRIDQYCRLRNGFISFKKGIRRIYKKGHLLHSRILPPFDMVQLHEYRKISKYLQFQMEFIQPVYPKLLKAYTATIDNHTELLGDVRDHDRLGLYIKNTAVKKIPSATKNKLQEKIMNLKEEMLEKVLPKSEMIYAEKPKEFIKRIQVYWNQYYKRT